MITVTITGGQRLSRTLARGGIALQRANQALYVGANQIFNASQRVTPVDTGALRGSGTIKQSGGAGGAEAEIKYGGTAASYAIYVHEGTYKMAARKYLEGPMVELGPGVLDEIATAVRTALL